jgi:hypothetical protein
MKIDMGKILEEEILRLFGRLKSDGERVNADIAVQREHENYIAVFCQGRVLFQGKLFDDEEVK